MTFKEKIDKLLVINKKNINSLAGLELFCGLSVGSINKNYSKNKEPGLKVVKTIKDKLGINEIWWETGSGEPFIEKPTSDSKSGNTGKIPSSKNEAVYILTETIYVPLVKEYAYAGYMSGFSDPEYIEDLPKIPWEVDREGKGNYLSFEVRGNSMDDDSIRSYPEGTIVLGREVQKHHWQNKLHIKRYRFIIIHKVKGILIKEIIRHDLSKNTIVIHSLNPDYEDQEINLDDVSQIFNVIKKQIDE